MKILILFIFFTPFLYAKFDKDGPKIEDLHLWINKMPFTEIDGHNLMSSKELVEEMTKIIGTKKVQGFLKSRKQFSIVGGSADGFITFGFCPKFCTDNFHVYVNFKTKKVYICETIDGEDQFKRVWYSVKGKVEFNNLTKDNMIYCDFPNPVDQIGVNWKEAIEAFPKEIL